MDWINAFFQGILLGGLYALFASGLALIFGVMRLVNIAHGDLIVLAAYLALAVVSATGLNPLLAIVIVAPTFALFGYGLQRIALNPTIQKDLLPSLLVTFGLSIIIQNSLLLQFSADSRRLSAGPIETMSFTYAGLSVGILPLLIFVAAIVVISGLQFVFYRTRIGMVFRATADDPEITRLQGHDNRHVFAMAFALASAVIACAGVFLAVRSNFDPSAGPVRLLFGFEAIIIGGLGNIWATLAGGIVLGVAQTLGAQISPVWQVLAGHLAFLAILVVRPNGLFPRR